MVLGAGGAALLSNSSTKSVIDLDGKPYDPFSAAPNKIVVLIFVRTDCPIANRYAPTIQQLSALHQDKTNFFLVYPDKNEAPEAIRKHDREFGFGLGVMALRDPHHVLVGRSGAQITPEAAVFDAHQRLVYHGRIDNLYEDFSHSRRTATTHELADAIDAAIAGKTLNGKGTPAVGCYISDLE
jgi:hypothetical protein